MNVRRARQNDIERINELLLDVAAIHNAGRPDIFKESTKKYTDEELLSIIENDKTPVFVAEDDTGYVLGYVFCVYQETRDSILLHDMKTLYIDDLCVDKTKRGMKIGSALYEFVLKEAKNNACYNVTLNVWSLNGGAMKFYEKCGMSPLKTVMEKVL